MDVAGWIMGTTGLAAGVIFGLDQMRRSRRLSDQLARLETRMIERAPEGAEAVARRVADEPSRFAPLEGASLDPETIASAITDLPAQEKLVLTLYYYEELTLREIGEILGVSESRVSELLTKAVLRLKSRLAGG